MKKFNVLTHGLYLIAILGFLLLAQSAAWGASAGGFRVSPQTPQIQTSQDGTASFSAGSGLFAIDAPATQAAFATGSSPITNGQVWVRVTLDANGVPLTSASPNLVVTGSAMDGASSYGSPLLEGNVTETGFVNNDATADIIYLRFDVVGGSLAAHPGFANGDGVLRMVLEGSSFAGTFTADFGCGTESTRCKVTLGSVPPAALGDRLWRDLDGDGVQDCSESIFNGADGIIGNAGDSGPECAPAGVPGATVELLTPGDDGVCGTGDEVSVATDVTDSEGLYLFEDLTPQDYCVRFDITGQQCPNGGSARFTLQDEGDNLKDSDVDPASGQTGLVTAFAGVTNRSIDAGIYCPAELGDRVWDDSVPFGQTPDGIQNTDGGGNFIEPGVVGFPVELYRCDAQGNQSLVAQTLTASDGFYLFEDLRPGTYSVKFVLSSLPDFQFTTLMASGSASENDSDADTTTGGTGCIIELEPGESDRTWDAGVFMEPTPPAATASLGDRLFEDLNRNGRQDDNEPDVDPQQYGPINVRLFDNPDGDPSCGSGDETWRAQLALGGLGSDIGRYLFESLEEGDYCVEFDLPPPAFCDIGTPQFTLANESGVDDGLDSDVDPATGRTGNIFLPEGVDDRTWDAGVYCATRIGDRFWDDSFNPDGVQGDAGSEPGIDGITVNLYQCLSAADPSPQLIASATTSGGGFYLFEQTDSGDPLDPGLYEIEFVIPPALVNAGYVFTQSNAGSDDALDSDAVGGRTGCVVNAVSNTETLTWDGGAKAPNASLGNRLFEDKNANGIQDSGEPGVSGVNVILYENGDGSDADCAAAEMLEVDQTNGNDGIYGFDALFTGNYCVKFEVPEDFCNVGTVRVSPRNVGNDDAVDSDIDPATLFTGNIFLPSDVDDDTWDAGIYCGAELGDRVWLDIDRDGEQDCMDTNGNQIVGDAGDQGGLYLDECATGQNGRSITLLTPGADGECNTGDESMAADIGSTPTNPITTDTGALGGDGFYRFTDLEPGLYCVQTDVPSGLECTAENVAGVDDARDSDGAPEGGTTVCQSDDPIQDPIVLSSGDSELTWDFGLITPPQPGVTIEKATNGIDADDPNGADVPALSPGDVIEWTYVVTNTGNTYVAKDDVLVVDDNGTPGDDSDDFQVSFDSVVTEQGDPGVFEPGDVWLYRKADGVALDLTDQPAGSIVQGQCTAGGSRPPANAYVNTATVTIPDDVSAIDPSSYCNPLEFAAIGNEVFEDSNRNGVRDAGEPGVGGATLSISGPGGFSDSAMTGADGAYLFDRLVPGDYTLTCTPPAGYELTTPFDAGSTIDKDSNADPASGGMGTHALASGETNLTIDCGLVLPADPRIDLEKATNGEDADAPTGPALSVGDPVTWTYVVENIGNIDLIDAVITDDKLGQICTIASLPVGAADSCTATGTAVAGQYRNDATVVAKRVDDPDGDDVTDEDPSHYIAEPALAGLGDFVFLDEDGDGAQDNGEAGIENVIVTLRAPGDNGRCDSDDQVIATTSTDSDGAYAFTDLAAGDYCVTFPEQLAAFPDLILTGRQLGGAPANDSDGPVSDVVTLAPGDFDPTIDAGYKEPPPDGGICIPSIDFDLQGLPAGTVVSDQFLGVTVSATDHWGNPKTAMIFDSANPTGGDPDLGTPNEQYGGPGIGSGGDSNQRSLGNILIISEDNDSSDPNDDHRGGQLIFDFDQPTRISQLEILDIDSGETMGYVAAFDAAGNEIASADILDAGNNSYQLVALEAENVSRLVVFFPSSGAVGSLAFCPDIDIRKQEEGPDQRTFMAGDSVPFEIVVTNTGEDPLADVLVSDPLLPDCDRSIGALAPGDSTTYACTGSAGGSFGDRTFADHFDTRGFGNNDGDADFSADWYEYDVENDGGASQDPHSGNVVIGSNRKVWLDDYPNTNTDPSIARALDLSGATSATLSFDWTVHCGVDHDDRIVAEVSDDGGDSWNTLHTFTGFDGSEYCHEPEQSESFDISAYAGAGTVIRFRVDHKYGGNDETFKIDDVVITAQGGGSGGYINEACVTGIGSGGEVGDCDTSEVIVEDDPTPPATTPAIDIRKQDEGDDERSFAPGETVTFAIEVSNAGTEDLVDVAVSDPLTPACDAVIGVLEVGASHSYSCETMLAAGAEQRVFLDDLKPMGFEGNDGETDWSGPWIEYDAANHNGVDQDPSSGRVRIGSNEKIWLNDYTNTGTEPSIMRTANLSGMSAATLSFDWTVHCGVDTSDEVVVEVSADGGATWSTLSSFTGFAGNDRGPNGKYCRSTTSESFDISVFAAQNTTVRFRVANLYGGKDETFKVDNVKIVATGGESAEGFVNEACVTASGTSGSVSDCDRSEVVVDEGASEPPDDTNEPGSCPIPVLDGETDDWDLDADFYAKMYEAGRSDKDHLSNAYVRYADGMLHVLVLTTPGHVADQRDGDAWVKIYDLGNGTQVDGGASDFSWVYDDNGLPIGYEAAFVLAPGTYDAIEIHLNVDGGETSSTGKWRWNRVSLTVAESCPAKSAGGDDDEEEDRRFRDEDATDDEGHRSRDQDDDEDKGRDSRGKDDDEDKGRDSRDKDDDEDKGRDSRGKDDDEEESHGARDRDDNEDRNGRDSRRPWWARLWSWW